MQTNSKRNTENCSLAQPSLSEIKLNYAVKLNDTETKGFQGDFETFLNKDMSHLTSVNQRARGGGRKCTCTLLINSQTRVVTIMMIYSSKTACDLTDSIIPFPGRLIHDDLSPLSLKMARRVIVRKLKCMC